MQVDYCAIQFLPLQAFQRFVDTLLRIGEHVILKSTVVASQLCEKIRFNEVHHEDFTRVGVTVLFTNYRVKST